MNRFFTVLTSGLFALGAAQAAASQVVVNGQGSTFIINPISGFTDPTYGAQRLAVFEAAAEYWADRLVSTVPIVIDAEFAPLSCSQFSAILGSAGPVTAFYSQSGGSAWDLADNRWYPVALFNAKTGTDNAPGNGDISAQFNSSIDNNANCLGSSNWYYGLDHNPPGSDIDFYEVVLHELAHGLGVLTFVDAGGNLMAGMQDSYSVYLKDKSTGKTWAQMQAAERFASMTDVGDLVWSGSEVNTLAGDLTSGVNGGEVQMYAPSSYQSGSSVSHFDTALMPNELMEPQYTGDMSSDHTLALLRDIGWTTLTSTVNQVPVITGQATLQSNEDTALTLSLADLTVSDSDNSYPADFTLNVLSGANYTVSGAVITPASNFNGTLTVPVTVNDGLDNSANFNLTITVLAVNDAPVLSGSPSTSVTRPDSYSADFDATDVDGDSLTFSLVSNHSWLSINSSGLLSGTPSASDVGTETVTVQVSDGQITDQIQFSLTVQDVSSADLGVSATLNQALSKPGDAMRITWTVRNAGPATLADGSVTVSVPSTLTVLSMDNGCLAQGAGLYQCDFTALASATEFSADVSATADGVYSFTSSVTGNQSDADSTNDADTLYWVVSTLASPLPQTTDGATSSDYSAFAPLGSDSFVVATNETNGGEHWTLSQSLSVTSAISGTANSADLISGDWNQDGHTDVAFANQADATVHLGSAQGLGVGVTLNTGATNALTAADVNGDQYLDLIYAAEGANLVYLNNQQGAFSLAQSLGSGHSRDVTALDVNQDGWLDLVFANDSADIVYLNRAGASGDTFEAVGVALDATTTNSRAVLAVDINNDGVLNELLVARVPKQGQSSITLYRVTGLVWTELDEFDVGVPIDITLSALTESGLPSILSLSQSGVLQQWQVINGSLAEQRAFSTSGALAIAAFDLNADGNDEWLLGGDSSFGVRLVPSNAPTEPEPAVEPEETVIVVEVVTQTTQEETTQEVKVSGGSLGTLLFVLFAVLYSHRRTRQT